jgi:hypothetical protein
MNKYYPIGIQIPHSFNEPVTYSVRYELGWNEAIRRIKQLNESADFEEICLMDKDCPCEDCQKENIKMD